MHARTGRVPAGAGGGAEQACASVTAFGTNAGMIRVFFALLLAVCGVASAAPGPLLDLDLPEQTLGRALIQLAREAGVEIAFSPDVVGPHRAPAVDGRLRLEDALDRLLAGTGMEARWVGDNTLLIVATPQARQAPRLTEGRSAERGPPAEPLPSVEPPDTPDHRPEELFVTGSRVQRSGMTTETPLATVSRMELSGMAPDLLINALDQLPQFMDNNTPAVAGNMATAGGSSVLNLRGIGSNRTLVLLDGRRVVPSTRLGVTDINLFPDAMIRGVETVTGGASAAYGSDAVTGVVNILLDSEFTGVHADLQGGITRRGDNASNRGTLTVGTPIGDRLHVMASAERYRANRIETYEGRNWFRDWGYVTNPDWAATGEGPALLTLPNVGATGYTFGGLIQAPGSALHRLMFMPDGSAMAFVEGDVAAIDGGSRSQSGGTVQNFERDNVRMLPDVHRDNAFARLNVAAGPDLDLFVQALRGHSEVDNRSRGPLQFSAWHATVFRDNAFLDEALREVMIDEGLESFTMHRMASTEDLAQSRLIHGNTTLSLTTGFAGRVGDWRLNGHYQYGRNRSLFRMHRFTRTDRLHFAMDAVRHPDTGETVCRVSLYDPVDPQLQGCVPANLFGAGNVSDAAMDYILDPDNDKTIHARVQQHFAEVFADGELHPGWGAGPVGAAVGLSYRDDRIDQRIEELPGVPRLGTPENDPDRGIRGIPPGFAGGDTVRQFSNAPDIDGGYSVGEAFAEALLPLTTDLGASVAARFADYSGSGGVWAWKTGLSWQATGSLRLRATRSRDTRAANLSERYDAQYQGTIVADPAFGGATFSLSQVVGGNPEVRPELGDTVTAGLVYQPSWLEGLSVSADWFDVRLTDAISLLGVQRIVDECFAGVEALCEQVDRNPDSGELRQVRDVYLNVAEARVRGMDLELLYETPVQWLGGGTEHLRLRLLAGYMRENSTRAEGGQRLDLAGGVTRPDWRSLSSLTYGNGPFTWYVQHRFINSTLRRTRWTEGVDVDINRVASATYVDTRLSWRWAPVRGLDVELYAHASNLFDRDPPRVPDFFEFFGATQTDQSVFDVVGMRLSGGVSVRF